MTFVREHALAIRHPLNLAGHRRADAAVKAGRKYDRDLAARKRARAEKLLEEASELEYQANKFYEHETRYAALREKIEDEAYWAARAAVGELPRDENGEYTTPAPLWRVTLGDEVIGEFRGEERYDVLRVVCPKGDPRNWGDFELTLVEEA